MHAQDEFGVKARREGREWLMTRLPARVFRDGSPKGALFTVGWVFVLGFVCCGGGE